jgi:hypothetical protein
MPSTHQTPAATDDYESEPKKMLATKNDLTLAALIRGIRDPDRAQAYIDAEIALAADEDRDPRKDIIGACNRTKAALESRETADTPIESDTADHTDDDKEDDTPATNRQSGDDSDNSRPYPEAERFDDGDALAEAVAAHEHGDVLTSAKRDGTLAVCFDCESRIGFVPRDRDDG